jgi:hypothetical protein
MRIRLIVATAVSILATALTACSGETTGSGDQAQTTASAEPSLSGFGSRWVADEGGDSLTVLDAAA